GGRRSERGPDAGARGGAGVAQGDQQGPQRCGEHGPLVVVQGGEDPVLVRDVVGQRAVDQGAARWGQRDQHAPPVVRARRAGDQAARLQPVQALGDRPGGHHGRARELGGGQRPVVAAQGGEHVERGGVEVVVGERGLELRLDEPGGAGEPPDHPHRGHVEVGPLLRPLGQDVVDGVGSDHDRKLSTKL
ncbi:MAG: hypothetical protein AVDCRST_MAG66-3173, partial [uncultured Pseudonocardia sp.]